MTTGITNWTPRQLTADQALPKMRKNALKAIGEHKIGELCATVEEMNRTNMPVGQPAKEVSCEVGYHRVKSTCNSAYHFGEEGKKGIVTGIFEGHGGDIVAQYAAACFSELEVDEIGDNAHAIFEGAFDHIEQQVKTESDFNFIGAQGVVCYIDKTKGYIYTATLGMCEAYLYREIDGIRKSIPLSCVRTWHSPRDNQKLPPNKRTGEDLLFFTPQGDGISYSRALGDHAYKPGPTHKPKITWNRVHAGDHIVIGCSKVMGEVSQEDIISEINKDDEGFLPEQITRLLYGSYGATVVVQVDK